MDGVPRFSVEFTGQGAQPSPLPGPDIMIGDNEETRSGLCGNGEQRSVQWRCDSDARNPTHAVGCGFFLGGTQQVVGWIAAAYQIRVVAEDVVVPGREFSNSSDAVGADQYQRYVRCVGNAGGVLDRQIGARGAVDADHYGVIRFRIRFARLGYAGAECIGRHGTILRRVRRAPRRPEG
nr:hypothetical protein [Nocardia sp. BMG51109]